jgi:hypothetical protein
MKGKRLKNKGTVTKERGRQSRRNYRTEETAAQAGCYREMSSILADHCSLVNEPNCGGRGGVAGSQPMSTAVHRSPNKLWRSNSIFNPWAQGLYSAHMGEELRSVRRGQHQGAACIQFGFAASSILEDQFL